MAMVNESLVKFGYGLAEKALNTAGFITFASDTRQLFVGDGSTAVAFAGNVKDAVFADKKLTITYNDGTASAVLDFSDVASAEGVSSLLSDLRKNINENTATISKIDAAYKLADSSIRADFAAADNAINDKIGVVADGKTVVGLIEEAKSAASAAHSVVAEDSEFLTIETSTNASTGAVTYTLKTTNVASAEDLEAVSVIADAAQTSEEVQTAITNKIDNLAGGDEGVDDSSFVKVAVTSSKGEVTDVTVTTTDIASAKTLADVKGRLDTFLAGENLDTTLDTLKEIQDWINGPGVDATELTEAIAEETKLRKEADASIRIDFAAADSSIREDVSAYQTSNNAAVQANATAIDNVSTNFNTHKDDSNIHVTTNDKLKWNAAEQNAKDYADGLVFNCDASITAIKNSYVISFGGAKGAISVDTTNVSDGEVKFAMDGSILKGSVNGWNKLGTAAFTSSDAYDSSGAAEFVKSEIIGDSDEDTSASLTIQGVKKYANEVAQQAQNAATVTGVDSTSKADAEGYVTIALALDNKKVKVNSVIVDTKPVADASVNDNGLATALDVKNYVDSKELRWTVLQ